MAARNPHAQLRNAVKVEEFAPEVIVKFLSECAEAGKPVTAPCKQEIHTVVVFADICRFTALSEWFAKQGGLGSEELGFFLNRYFELLVKTVSKHGGDVVKFAGDAMLIQWPEELKPTGEVDLRTMCMRAVMCCTAVQTELGRAKLKDNVEFNIKLGIGVGQVNVIHIGGVFGRLEYLCTGEALMQAFGCEHDCQPGGVVVSEEVWKKIGPALDGTRLSSGNVIVKEVISKIRTKRLQRTEPSPYLSDVPKLLRSYVPAAILPHLQYSSRKWASELRTLTVLFVNLGFTPADLVEVDDKRLNKLNDVLRAVQKVIYQYEGSLNKFLIDDKGSTLLAVLGLPPLAHADDPERGVLAAVGVAESLRRLGMTPYIGVTSGIALCGPTGAGTRREYSVLGDVVNTSARLMQMAKMMTLDSSDEFLGCIICDYATKSSAESNSSLVFQKLKPLHLKGKTKPVRAFQPGLLRRPSGHVPVLWDNKSQPVVQGFHGLDVDMLEKVQGMIFSHDAPNPVLLGGENGSGKTTMVKHFVRKAATLFGAVLAVPMPEYSMAESQLHSMMGNVNSVFDGDSWFESALQLLSQPSPSQTGLPPTGLQGTRSGNATPQAGAGSTGGGLAAGAGGTTPAAGVAAGTGEAPQVAADRSSTPTGELRRSSGSNRSLLGPPINGSSGRNSASDFARSPKSTTLHRTDSRGSMHSLWTLGERRASTQPPRSTLSQLAGRRASVDSTYIIPHASPGMRRFSAVSRQSGGSFRGLRQLIAGKETDYSMIKARPRKRRSFARRRFIQSNGAADAGGSPDHPAPSPDAVMGGTLWKGREPSSRSILRDQARPLYPCRIVYSIAQTFRESVRCFVWRQVVHQLTVDLEHCYPADARQEVYGLACGIRDQNLFAPDTAADKAELELSTILRLVELHSQHVPLVIIMDEMQWASDREWVIIEALAQLLDRSPGVPCFLLVVTQPLHNVKYQPNFRPVSKAYFRFLGMLSTEYWQMEPMNRAEMDALIRQALCLQSVPGKLSSIVGIMSGGSPRFAKKFLSALEKMQIVNLVNVMRPDNTPLLDEFGDEVMSVGMNLSRLDVLPLPYQVQRITATFIDRLTDRQNLILKMACVLCLGGGITYMVFDLHLLFGSFPGDRGRRRSEEEAGVQDLFKSLLHNLYEMCQFGVLMPLPYPVESGEYAGRKPEDHPRRFAFSAGVIRDVVYHRMLHKQRKQQHKLAADYLRREFAANPSLSDRIPARELNKHIYRHLKLAEERDAAETHYKTTLAGGGSAHRHRRYTTLTLTSPTADSAKLPAALLSVGRSATPGGHRKRSSLFVSMFKNAIGRTGSPQPSPKGSGVIVATGGSSNMTLDSGETVALAGQGSGPRAGLVAHSSGGRVSTQKSPARLVPRGSVDFGNGNGNGNGAGVRVQHTADVVAFVQPEEHILTRASSTDSHDIHSDHEAEVERLAAAATPKRRSFGRRLLDAMSCARGRSVVRPAVKTEAKNRARRRRLSHVPVVHITDQSNRFRRASQSGSPMNKPAFENVGNGFGVTAASVQAARRRASTDSPQRAGHRLSLEASPSQPRSASVQPAQAAEAGRIGAGAAQLGSAASNPAELALGAEVGGGGKGEEAQSPLTRESLDVPGSRKNALPPISTNPALQHMAADMCITPGRNGLRVHTSRERAGFGEKSAEMGHSARQFVRSGTWRVIPRPSDEEGLVASASVPAGKASTGLGAGTSAAKPGTPTFRLNAAAGQEAALRKMAHDSVNDSLVEAATGDMATPLQGYGGGRDAIMQLNATGSGKQVLFSTPTSGGKRRRFSDSATLQLPGSTVRSKDDSSSRRPSFYGLADDAEDQLRVAHIMRSISNWQFNVMALDHVSDGTPLLHVTMEVFDRCNLFSDLQLDREVVRRFATDVEDGYLDHPFHNSVHAADTLQTAHVLLKAYEQYHPVSPLKTLSLFLAAMIHDFKHPGVTNYYVQVADHPIRTVYKGHTGLEQFHFARGMEVARRCELLDGLPDEQRMQVMATVESLVLATSLASHFDFCQQVDSLLQETDLDHAHPEMEEVFLKLLLKLADVSYVGKPFPIHKLWVDRFSSECFAQGDLERNKGLPISTYHDRFTSTAAQCQLALGTFIAVPLFKKFARVAPMANDLYQGHVASNARFWQHEDRCHGRDTLAKEKARVPLMMPMWQSTSIKDRRVMFSMVPTNVSGKLVGSRRNASSSGAPGNRTEVQITMSKRDGAGAEESESFCLSPKEVMVPDEEQQSKATEQALTHTMGAGVAAMKAGVGEEEEAEGKSEPSPMTRRRKSAALLKSKMLMTRAAVSAALAMRVDVAHKVRFSLANSFL